jgi:3-deoxy-D-manno-octulosonic acid (KDO) 8-phosphate synthase
MSEIPEAPVTTPATFNVEDWLQDAHLPEESADVFKRADVLGELSALQRKIATHQEVAAVAEASAADTSELHTLLARYDELLQTFGDSQLTIYVRAISPDEKRTMRAAHEARTKDMTTLEQNAEFGYDLLAASIVAVRPFGGDRTAVTWSAEQVQALENRIGGAQMSTVLDAHRVAQNKVPVVDADFLRRRSGSEAGAE